MRSQHLENKWDGGQIKTDKMKITMLITCILSGITFGICKIWIIVSFILYLVKDEPFNWAVFWTAVWMIPICLVSYVATMVMKDKPRSKRFTPVTKLKKSKFAQRLEEAKRLQEERRKI